MFKELPSQVNFPRLEQNQIEFWRKQDIFKKSMQKEAPNGNYIFYEGPPTANGKPGVHHVISRAFKDVFPRYKTMRGYHVNRKGGWDTHGLPVELEIEKKLGFTGKKDIEKFGIAKFNKLAKESAFEYIQEWNEMTERIAFWVDLEDAYITYENDYIESTWWVMKSLWERGLLKEDYRVTMHCPRCNTSLADHEVSQGYKDDTKDPSVFPKFPANLENLVSKNIVKNKDREVYFLAWTTTPWTLAANSGLAVKDDAQYSLVEAAKRYNSEDSDLYILATDLLETVFGEDNYKIIKSFQGSDLVGVNYQPILKAHIPANEDISTAYRVISDEFVSLDDGTGIVHLAPAYGDLELGKKYAFPTLFSVNLSGEIYPEVMPLDSNEKIGPYAGIFYKKADKLISKDLLDNNLMFRETTLKHTYPFCWRCDTPLLFFAKSSWYIKTTLVKDKLISNNQAINWYPDKIKNGRFGKWLENNVDWALSRERYWGSPLPIWVNKDGSKNHCIGSIAELEELTGKDLKELDLHRPYVDEISFEIDGETYTRLPYTVDVWFESGCMPYAQWHYPFENQDKFVDNFPADYICEAIDQTRGWFYSQHAVATLLSDSGDPKTGRAAGVLAQKGIATDTSDFKNVICLGHILDEKGLKMSKSKGNIVDPWEVLNVQGADALRWYLFASSPPGDSKRFSANLVNETLRDFFLTLWNSYSFFVLYANLDKPDLKQTVAIDNRPEIDRWLVAKTHKLIKDISNLLDNYDPTNATRTIRDFVVDDLSNWYVRRNRRRFWKSESDTDKLSAYKSLYETLVVITKLIAPMAPFISEELYQNLVLSQDTSAPESVHLAAWPEYDENLIDKDLLRDMTALIKIVELGRSARNASKVKIRQPLPEVLVRVKSTEELAGLKHLEDQILEELNVKKVSYLDVHADFVDYSVKPNLFLVGKRLGKLIPEMRKQLANIDGKTISANIRDGKNTIIELAGQEHSFEPEAFLLEAQSPDGYSAVEDRGYLAALNTTLSPELIQEGLSRDIIRLIQNARKTAGLEVSDHINLALTAKAEVLAAIEAFKDIIAFEVLADKILINQEIANSHSENLEIEGKVFTINLKKS